MDKERGRKNESDWATRRRKHQIERSIFSTAEIAQMEIPGTWQAISDQIY